MPPKKKKNNNKRNKKTFEIIYAYKDIGQEYGTIEKSFGNCHFKVISVENQERVASLSGIIGSFGKNFSGKSSIIDAALYTLFNTTSKNERKNLKQRET